MQRPSDELLVAYLDGELSEAERSEVQSWLARDPALRDRLAGLAETTALVRQAFDDDLRDELPARLIAAARGGATVVPLAARPRGRARQWVGVALAASVAGIVVGSALGWFAGNSAMSPLARDQVAANNAAGNWLDNIAGYHQLLVSAAGKDSGLVDLPASDDIKQVISAHMSQDFRMPDLKAWGLAFQGARLLVIEGRPAAQLFYMTDNAAIGPLTVVVATSKRPDMSHTFDRRGDINLLYWRHQGRAYAIAGQADIGYLWGIAQDIGWQLDAI